MRANRGSGGIPWAAVRTVMVHAGLWAGFALLLILPEASWPGGPPPWAERITYAVGILCLTVPPAYAHFVLLERCLLRGRYALHAPRAGTGDAPRGIGLQNVRRRLALLYPGAHELVIGETNGVFRVELKLDDVLRSGRR